MSVAAIHRSLMPLAFLVSLVMLSPLLARPDKETRDRFYGDLTRGSSRNTSGDGSIAEMFDRLLEKEFSSDNEETPDGTDTTSFNNSVAGHQAVLETVAIITHDKQKKNDTSETNATKSFQFQRAKVAKHEKACIKRIGFAIQKGLVAQLVARLPSI